MKRFITDGQIMQLAFFLRQAVGGTRISWKGVSRLIGDGPAVKEFKRRIAMLVMEFCPDPELLPDTSILWNWKKSDVKYPAPTDAADMMVEVAHCWDLGEKPSLTLRLLKAASSRASVSGLVAVMVRDLRPAPTDVSDGWIDVKALQHYRLKYGWRLCPVETVLDLLVSLPVCLKVSQPYHFMIDPIDAGCDQSIYGLKVIPTMDEVSAGSVCAIHGSENLRLNLDDVVVFAYLQDPTQ